MKKKNQAKIKVFLVDDHPAVREGVRSYLANQGSFLVVGEAGDDTDSAGGSSREDADLVRTAGDQEGRPREEQSPPWGGWWARSDAR